MNSFLISRRDLSRFFGYAMSLCIFLSLLNIAPASGQEKKRCITGVNYPWVAYGHDFGKNEWGHDGIITGGWTYQTFEDTQGFTDSRLTKAQSHSGIGSLAITAALIGKHPNRSSGEVHFDLNNHRIPGSAKTLNLANTTARCWVRLPKGSAGDPNAPNGAQIFFKSRKGNVFSSAYSEWNNILPAMEERWVHLTANPSHSKNTYTGDFDPENVIEIGLKVATNSNSTATLNGIIYLDDFALETTPPLVFDFEKLEAQDDFSGFQQAFGECVIGVVRVFIFTDGRAAPEFSSSGEVMGLDEYFLQDFDALVEAAKQRNLLLIPVLLDFSWLDVGKEEAGARLAGHSDILRDPAKRQSFIDRALKPLVQRYCDSSQILAWEVINEPEWAMKEIEKDFQTTDPVTIKEMQDFVRACAEAVHSCSGQKVTVGSARRAWLNFWRGLGLDLYQFHWYDKFEIATPPDQFPWAPYSELGLDKPCIIGEVPTANTNRSAEQFLEAARDGGYEGVLFWSHRADDLFTDFSSAKPALEAWCSNLVALVKQVVASKKQLIVEGECLDCVKAVLVNQKPIDPGRLTITPTRITASGKFKKLGVKRGNNQLQLILKNEKLTPPFEFVF